MTVFLYSGTPGSGKSLHVAELIYWRLRVNKPVVANFQVNVQDVKNGVDRFGYVENSALTPKLLQDFAIAYWNGKPVVEGEIKLFIDECQVKFNPRDWRAADRRDWITFFSQHRKFGYDVYLVAQNDGMVDKQIRALVEYEVKHRKVNNFGWVGKFLGLFAINHPIVCAVTYWYGMKQRLSSEFFVGRKKYYAMYDTMRIFG